MMAVDVPRRGTNIRNENKGWLSMTLNETARCVHTLFEDDLHLTITDMRWEMAAHFSHEASEAKVVCAL